MYFKQLKKVVLALEINNPCLHYVVSKLAEREKIEAGIVSRYEDMFKQALETRTLIQLTREPMVDYHNRELFECVQHLLSGKSFKSLQKELSRCRVIQASRQVQSSNKFRQWLSIEKPELVAK